MDWSCCHRRCRVFRPNREVVLRHPGKVVVICVLCCRVFRPHSIPGKEICCVATPHDHSSRPVPQSHTSHRSLHYIFVATHTLSPIAHTSSLLLVKEHMHSNSSNMCIRNTKSPRNTMKMTYVRSTSSSCITNTSDGSEATIGTGNTGGANSPSSHTEQTHTTFISRLNDHEQTPKRQCRRNLPDRNNSIECRYIDSKARHVLLHAKDILDEIDGEKNEMTRWQQQNDQEKEENKVVQTAPATQTSKICWAGKKESHFFAFGYLLTDDNDDDDDDDDEDAIDSDDE